MPEGFVERKEVQDNVVEYFASFDEAIRDFSIEELPGENEEDNSKSYEIDALHKMGDSLKGVLDQGSTLFIDELIAALKPMKMLKGRTVDGK